MVAPILSNFSYTLHFSPAQMRDHRQLLLVGSILSQLFDEITIPDGALSECSMQEVLQQFLRWTEHGQALAAQWNQLAKHLQSIYDNPSKEE